MRVLYDHQVFSAFRYGGILRYFCSLLNAFEECHDMTISVPLRYSSAAYLPHIVPKTNVTPYLDRWEQSGFLRLPAMLVNGFIVKPLNTFRALQNRQLAIQHLKKQQFDIFHPTYYDPYFLEYIGSKPFVVTVHDLIHERFPHLYASQNYVVQWKQELLRRASAIIAVSHFTKNDLVSYYQLSPGKVLVVYHANSLEVDRNDDADVLSSLQLPQRYLLFVGDRKGYKNFEFCVKSLAEYLLHDSSLYLLCGGSWPFTETETTLLQELGISSQVRHIRFQNDLQLIALYRNALAFIFPSLYEGFGIPVLEAFACRCPVLICNAGALPEVAGDACLKFDPDDTVAFRDAVKEIITNEHLREELKKAGERRLNEFSWQLAAMKTKEVYRRLI